MSIIAVMFPAILIGTMQCSAVQLGLLKNKNHLFYLQHPIVVELVVYLIIRCMQNSMNCVIISGAYLSDATWCNTVRHICDHCGLVCCGVVRCCLFWFPVGCKAIRFCYKMIWFVAIQCSDMFNANQAYLFQWCLLWCCLIVFVVAMVVVIQCGSNHGTWW